MSTRSIDWLNLNSYRRYPFMDDCDLTLTDDVGLIPLDALLDLSITDYALDGSECYLASITRTADVVPQLEFVFTYGGTSQTVTVSSDAEFPISVSIGSLGWGMRMTVTFGAGVATLVSTIGAGQTVTPVTSIRMQPAVVVKQIRTRVDSISAAGGTILTGRVCVEEGYNCRVTVLNSPASFKIEAGYGLGAGYPCTSETDQPNCSNVLLRMNGLSAGEYGDFTIAAGDGVTITPMANGLVIKGNRTYEDIGCG